MKQLTQAPIFTAEGILGFPESSEDISFSQKERGYDELYDFFRNGGFPVT